MKIHILDTRFSMPCIRTIRGNGTWDTADIIACGEAVSAAIADRSYAIIVDVTTFANRKTNRSYVVSSVIESLEDLAYSAEIPSYFTVYLAEAALEESPYINAFNTSTQPRILMNALVEFDDSIREMFEDYQINTKAGIEFRELIYKLMDKKRIEKASDVYKAAGVSKSVFSRITSFDGIEPSLPKRETVAALCIGLRLTLDEAQALYQSAGYHLGTSDFVDRVIRFFISHAIYDIDQVNGCLVHYGRPILGERCREDRKEAREAKSGKIEIKVGM